MEELKKMPVFNLIEKYKESEQIQNGIARLNLLSTHSKFKIGDKIEFTGGYNEDMRFQTEITGFDADGDIYVLWDSYWAPIRDNEKRAIKVIK